MTSIRDRYASAVNSSNLKSAPDTVYSDTDVLGCYAIADKRLSNGEDQYTKHPLAVPLERLFAGDGAAAGVITTILAAMIRTKAKSMRIKMTELQATDMARATLGWYRHPTCKPCGGHGFKIIPGTTTKGDASCEPCAGSGKWNLEILFRDEMRPLLRWAVARMELETSMAGPAAMRALKPMLEL